MSWDEFCDYYTDLSAGIDDDEYFEMMMRNLWHISGGVHMRTERCYGRKGGKQEAHCW